MNALTGVNPESLEQTVQACAWLHDIALLAERLETAPDGCAQWLETLGMACAGQLQSLGQFPQGGLQ